MLDLLGEIMGGLGKGQAVGTQNLPEFAIRFCAGEELQGTVPGHIAVGKRAVLSQKVAMGSAKEPQEPTAVVVALSTV